MMFTEVYPPYMYEWITTETNEWSTSSEQGDLVLPLQQSLQAEGAVERAVDWE